MKLHPNEYVEVEDVDLFEKEKYTIWKECLKVEAERNEV